MAVPAIETITKMIESLPRAAQDQAVEHLREYLEDVTDDIRWDESFAQTSDKLAEAARSVREQHRAGLTEAMDFDKL